MGVGRCVAVVALSFLAPGTGQAYLGERLQGLFFFFFFLVSTTAFYFSTIDISVLLASHFLVIVSAALHAAYLAWKSRRRPGSTSRLRLLRFLWLGGLLLIGAHVLIRSFVVENCRVHQLSMLPTLQPGDNVSVSRVAYLTGSPQRDDIVTIADPRSERLLVKRVVGVERDVLHLGDKSGLINGVTLEYEGPVPSEFLDDCVTSGAREVRIPEGQFFVLGDNQSQSIDSRNFGPIDREAIRGKAIKIFWSFDEGRGKIRWARIGLSR